MNLTDIFYQLLDIHGRQYWWPAETHDEIIIGAILTQNTSWANVEKAITNLKQYHLCTLKSIASSDTQTLAQLIRPSGYYNLKAHRLQCTARYITTKDWKNSVKKDPTSLRQKLLNVKGIGPETADSILLYAYDIPVFVIDAYTKRIFSRLGFLPQNASYQTYQELFMKSIPSDIYIYGEYHALIVKHSKKHCRVKPICEECCIKSVCASAL
jgi:endonuclease-3 related protein